jgi:hypothetical protein
MADKMLEGLLDKFEKKARTSEQEISQAEKLEAAWVARFETMKMKVLRPTMELLGKEVRKREHDFNIVELPFKRFETRPMPQESMIRIDVYLANERTKTVINAERRPYLKFESHHRSQMVQVTICDITSRGGVESKIGDFPVESIDGNFVKDKFVALFKRLLAQQPGQTTPGRKTAR